SGKSNIIDAIRWLLGEREAKNLRGAKSDDLIFAGSSKKPRMGLARATLYFENKNKFFPLDYSEITLSREVSRDGNSFYYLNKSEIRLKDLIDFLAKARLGTQGMIVITQGNSDRFVRASLDERREMIEETLGLKEYRLKKNEAIRKLKNTKINLDKVRALIDEILPHLRSLKRQTSKWEKRGLLEEELNQSLKVFFGSSFQKINAELLKIDLEIKNHLNLKENLINNKHQAEKYLKEIEANQPKEREELKEIKLQIENLMNQKNNLQKEIVKLEFHLEKLNNQKLSSGENLNTDQLLDLILKIKSKLSDLINNNLEENKTKVIIQEVLKDIDKIFKAEKNENEEYLEVKKELEKINQDLKNLDQQISLLKNKENETLKSQDNFYSLFKDAVQKLRLAESEFEKWEYQYQNLIFEKEKLELKISDWRHQVRQFNCDPNDFENIKEIEFNNLNLEELERKILKLRGELAAIGDIDESLLKEAKDTEERYSFLENQLKDLEQASLDLNNLIKELNLKIEDEFGKAFTKINLEFDKFFKAMFGGGQAKLKLVSLKSKNNQDNLNENKLNQNENQNQNNENEEDSNEKGIEIDIKLPMKKLTSLDVLSGGERSLIGIAA
ncbi:MAG: AAA family ATPase, partial [Minisyncoccia bacterium]